MIGIIGAGNMGGALARGWGEPVLASDSGSGRADALVKQLGGEVLQDNSELIGRADVIILAHRPEQLESVASSADSEGKLVISVLGPCKLDQIQNAYVGARVARAMPNLPVEVRRGVTCFAEGSAEDAVKLFERVGKVFVVPEFLMGLSVATMGVMPAYIALLAEAAIDASVCYGMPYPLAAGMVLETFAGTSELLLARDGDTLGVRRGVASPGESTVRGVATLERHGARTMFNDAVRSVLDRLSLPYTGEPVLGGR